MSAEQHEKSFQKQDAVFAGAKRSGGPKGKLVRYWRNVGLSIQTPMEAKSGKYIDKKCPFTGNVSIRGRILKGRRAPKKIRFWELLWSVVGSWGRGLLLGRKRLVVGEEEGEYVGKREREYTVMIGIQLLRTPSESSSGW